MSRPDDNDRTARTIISACARLLAGRPARAPDAATPGSIGELIRRARLVALTAPLALPFSLPAALRDGSFHAEARRCRQISEIISLVPEEIFKLFQKFLQRGYHLPARRLLARWLEMPSAAGGRTAIPATLLLFRVRALFEPAAALYGQLAGLTIPSDGPDSAAYQQLLGWLGICAGRQAAGGGGPAQSPDVMRAFAVQQAMLAGDAARVRLEAHALLEQFENMQQTPEFWRTVPLVDCILYLHCRGDVKGAGHCLERVGQLHALGSATLTIFEAIRVFCLEPLAKAGELFLVAATASANTWQLPYRNWLVLLAARAFVRAGDREMADRIFEALPWFACVPPGQLRSARPAWPDPAMASGLLPSCRNVGLWDPVLRKTMSI